MHFLEIQQCVNNADNNEIDLSDIEIVSIVKSDAHSLKPAKSVLYYIPPVVSYKRPLNLNLGWEDHIFLQPELISPMPSVVEHYLMTHLDNGKKDQETEQFLNDIHFCIRPATLKSIMMLPFDTFRKVEWELYATKFKGKIYVSVKKNPWQINTDPQPKDTYLFKFKQHILADSPKSNPVTDVPFDEHQKFSAVYHAKLGSLNLLYSSQISGVMNWNELTDLSDRKQLRSCQIILPKLAPKVKQWRTNFRILNWITKAHLIGIKNVCVGFQEKERPGFISTPVKHFTTDYLAELQPIKPKDCMPFVYTFLMKLQSLLTDVDCPYTTFVFKLDDKKANVFYEIHEGETEYSKLCKEFIDFMQTQQQ